MNATTDRVTAIALALDLDDPIALRWHLLALPSWDPTPAPKEPHGRPCARVTALVRTRQGLRAVVVEAATEGAALERIATRGVRP